MVKALGHSLPPPRRYQFPLWVTPTHHALHAFMVLVALWTSCSPRGSNTSNNPPGIKLYLPFLRPLATHSRLPGGACSLFGVPPLTIVDILIAVAPLYPIALPSSYLPSRLLPTILRCLSMPSSRVSSEPRMASGFDILSDIRCHPVDCNDVNNATLGDDAFLGDDATLSNDALLGNNATLSDNARLGDDATLGNNALLGNNATLSGDALLGDDAMLGEDALLVTPPCLATTPCLWTMPRLAITPLSTTTPCSASSPCLATTQHSATTSRLLTMHLVHNAWRRRLAWRRRSTWQQRHAC